MALKDIGINWILFGLFAFALLAAGVKFAIDNGTSVNIANDPNLSSFNSTLGSTLGTYKTDSSTFDTQLENSTPIIGEITTTSESFFTIWKTAIKSPKVVYDLTLGLLFHKIFGADISFAIVITTIGAILLVVIIFWAIDFIRTGRAQ